MIFHFFILMTFIEWNFKKTKEQIIFRKVQLHSLKKKKHIYACIEYLYSTLVLFRNNCAKCSGVSRIHYCALAYWKELFLHANPPGLMDFRKFWKRNENQHLRKLNEKPSIKEITIQICSPETRLSDWTFKK